MLDPFASKLTTVDDLRALYAQPIQAALDKDHDYLDELSVALIAGSPMVLVSSYDGEGRCDISPRGGAPGFVTVLDECRLAIPDATGNRRLDTQANIVETGRAGLIFLIPGRDTTLRVNGSACMSADPELLARLTPVGKPPVTAIVVEADEVFAHCPKAFIRSGLWKPETWPEPDSLPSSAEVTLAHLRDPGLTLAAIEERQREALRYRLE